MAMSGRPLGSMIVELDMQSTKFEDSLKSIQNKFRLAKSEMKANLSVLDTTGTSYEKASSKVDSLSKMMSVNEEQISSLKSRYDTAVKTNGEYSDSAMKIANQLNKAEGQQAQYQRQLDNAKVAMKEAARGTDSYREALNRVQRQVKVEVDSLTTQGRKTEASLVQYQALSKEINNYDKIISDEKNKLNELIETKGRDSKETQNQKAKVAELTATQEKAQYQYDELGKKVKNLSTNQAQSIDGMNRFSSKCHSVGSSIRGVGTKMTLGFTTPVVAGLGYATKSATDFSSEITNIKPLLEANGESVKQVKKEISEMADDSKKWAVQYGVSTKSINDGMDELVKRGYSAKQTMGAMPSILNATKASGDDFNSVMQVSTSTLEQFGLKSNTTSGMLRNTQRVTDSLTYTANATAAGFQDMGDAMTYVGPTAHAAGISLEETASAIGLMSNQGIEGSVAGTALRSALTRLMKPSKQNAEGLKELGVNAEDFKNHALTLPELLNKIKTNTQGWTKEKKAAAIATAFGTEAQAGMNVLVSEGGDALTDLTKKTEAAKGSTKKIADTMNNTAAANGAKFKESLHVLAITMGAELLPLVTPLIKKITSLIKSFSKMDKGTRKTIVTAALVAAAIGPILMLIGQMSLGISGLMKAFTGIKTVMAGTKLGAFLAPLGAFAVPIALAVAGVVALGVAFKVAYDRIKPFREWVNNLVKDIKTKVKDVTTVLKAVFTLFTTKAGSKGNNGVTDMLSKIFPKSTVKAITGSVNTVKGVIKGFFSFIKSVGSEDNGQSFFSKFLPKPLVDLIVANIKHIKKNFSDMGNSIKSVFSSLGKTVGPIFTKIGSLFGSVINKMVSMWNEKGSGLKQSFKVIFGFIATVVSTQMNVISTVINIVMGAISTEIKVALDLIKNIFSAVFNSLKDIVSGALDMVKGVFEIFAGIFTGNWKEVWNGVKDIFSGIWKSFKGIVGGVLNTIIGLVNTGIDGINWLTSKFGVSKIGHVSPVKFARGSTNQYPGGLPNNQLATVNDGGKKEIVVTPNGNAFVPDGWNTTMMLIKGSHVISGEDSEPILNATGFHYAGGSGLLSGFGKAVGNVGNSIKNGVEGAMDWVKDSVESATRFLKDPLGNLIKSFTSNIKFNDATQFVVDDTIGKGKYIAKSIKEKIVKEIKKWKDDKVDAEAVAGEPKAAKAWLPVVKKLMDEMGAKPPKGIDWEAAAFVREIARESGGNPTIRQAMSDDNSRVGNPAMGLLQFIPQTFMSYAVPGHKNILSGEDQIRATIHAYMRSGAWDRIGTGRQINFLANGGYFDIPTPAIIGEAGPEVVLPLTNKTRAMQILSAAQARFGNGASTSVSVDTTQIEENQKQQTLLLQIQNKILTKVLGLVDDSGSSDDFDINKLSNLLDQLGLKKRKLTQFQR